MYFRHTINVSFTLVSYITINVSFIFVILQLIYIFLFIALMFVIEEQKVIAVQDGLKGLVTVVYVSFVSIFGIFSFKIMIISMKTAFIFVA